MIFHSDWFDWLHQVYIFTLVYFIYMTCERMFRRKRNITTGTVVIQWRTNKCTEFPFYILKISLAKTDNTTVQWNPDFSNLQGRWKLVRKIGSSKKSKGHQIRPFFTMVCIRSKKADNNGNYDSCLGVNHLYLPTKCAFITNQKFKDLSQFRQNKNQYCTDKMCL